MTKAITIINQEIQSRIYTIRGVQVILDEDLAELYDVIPKVLNQAVKRNIERFPEEFMFQLTDGEFNSLRSQIVTLKNAQILRSQFVTLRLPWGRHRKYLPYVFTEQGVAMLAGVLRSDVAVKVSIQIINTFVEMRRFIASNGQIFQRLETMEKNQVETNLKFSEADQKFEKIFNAIEEREIKPKQGIFFDGQVFDAYKFVSDLIRSAKHSILLIDNYIDDTVLIHFSKRRKNIKVSIFTKTNKQLLLDVKKFNEQFPGIEINEFKNSHDRFLIIDEKSVYHFGASLKDLGKKWFAFSKMEMDALKILTKLKDVE